MIKSNKLTRNLAVFNSDIDDQGTTILRSHMYGTKPYPEIEPRTQWTVTNNVINYAATGGRRQV